MSLSMKEGKGEGKRIRKKKKFSCNRNRCHDALPREGKGWGVRAKGEPGETCASTANPFSYS